MDLQNHLKILQDDLDDTRNQSLKKTLIFQNIKQESLRQSWDTTKRILANEIHRVILHISPEEVPPIIAKFTDWTLTEEIKISFIKRAKNSRNNHIVYVSQKYSPAVTNRCNEAMKVHKQLINEDKQIQAYVKFPAILIIPAVHSEF